MLVNVVPLCTMMQEPLTDSEYVEAIKEIYKRGLTYEQLRKIATSPEHCNNISMLAIYKSVIDDSEKHPEVDITFHVREFERYQKELHQRFSSEVVTQIENALPWLTAYLGNFGALACLAYVNLNYELAADKADEFLKSYSMRAQALMKN